MQVTVARTFAVKRSIYTRKHQITCNVYVTSHSVVNLSTVKRTPVRGCAPAQTTPSRIALYPTPAWTHMGCVAEHVVPKTLLEQVVGITGASCVLLFSVFCRRCQFFTRFAVREHDSPVKIIYRGYAISNAGLSCWCRGMHIFKVIGRISVRRAHFCTTAEHLAFASIN